MLGAHQVYQQKVCLMIILTAIIKWFPWKTFQQTSTLLSDNFSNLDGCNEYNNYDVITYSNCQYNVIIWSFIFYI